MFIKHFFKHVLYYSEDLVENTFKSSSLISEAKRIWKSFPKEKP